MILILPLSSPTRRSRPGRSRVPVVGVQSMMQSSPGIGPKREDVVKYYSTVARIADVRELSVYRLILGSAE